MLKILLFVVLFVGCSSPPFSKEESNQPNVSRVQTSYSKNEISSKERARIFAAFDYINKQVWAHLNIPKNIEEYRTTLKKIPNGEKKEDVEEYLNKMYTFTCPLNGSFVLCGYLENEYSFCDDARKKLTRTRYKEHIGPEDMRKELSIELGCL